jgi:tetratricopeptide (TPR) repeat protein
MTRWALALILSCAVALAACGRASPPPAARAEPAGPVTAGVGSTDAQGMAMPHVPRTVADWARGAQLFDGLGSAHRAITTSSREAQQYFDQGMSLMWGFNHDEATRSFAKAAELDPRCASCFWGVSLTVGPNYNLPFLSAERAKVAFEARRLAEAQVALATPAEQALIGTLAVRYPSAAPLDPATALPVLTAYSGAMKGVAARFADDLDVQTLYAEALMNVHAWKLWTADGQPAPGTEEIVATLRSVLARDPRHLGANHYYVHALEASPHPDEAVPAADRLKTLAPAAGHLVHMPAHIFQRIGRYEDAAEANRRASVADDGYAARTRPPDYYPVMYTAHNYQFLAFSTAMEGRRAETLAAVDNSRRAVSDAMLLEMPGADWYVAELYTARVRFGAWAEILAMPAPDPRLPGLAAGYLFARAVAQAATGHVDEAHAALADLERLATSVPADAAAGQNTLRDVLAIAIPVVKARIAGAGHQARTEIDCLRQAVAAEDRLSYDEPKNWFFPVRHLLGAALLRVGEAREAERVYREDLHANPSNGWSLIGLRDALRAERRSAEAAAAEAAFNAAWKRADVALTASAY